MIENKLCEVQAELASGRHEVTRRGAVNKGLEQELPGRELLFAVSPQCPGKRVAVSHMGKQPASVPGLWPKHTFGNGM